MASRTALWRAIASFLFSQPLEYRDPVRADIASKAASSWSTTASKRLEDRGIITGYGARIDWQVLGLNMTAIVRLKTTHEHIRACLKTFGELPFVLEVHRVTGDDCFVLKVTVPTPDKLATIVDAIGRFGAVTTSVVLRSEPPKSISRELILAAQRK
jgi:Lrp/AsnC family transcriptional regulator, leucine-responsive regulatory protein